MLKIRGVVDKKDLGYKFNQKSKYFEEVSEL
jgi:hypothetical protein